MHKNDKSAIPTKPAPASTRPANTTTAVNESKPDPNVATTATPSSDSPRSSRWANGPAWLGTVCAAVAALVGVLNYKQGCEEKRLHVEPRVLWDVGAFREGDDWQFGASNTGGVDVEGYDVEFEAASLPLVRSA